MHDVSSKPLNEATEAFMESATRNQWLAAIRDAQREHDQRIRDTLGQSLAQMKAKTESFIKSRPAAIVAGWDSGEVSRQGLRSGATLLAAISVGFARGYAGDERFNVGRVPIELLLGLGAHLAGGTLLAGTPAALIAHGIADGVLGASAAQLGRELGGRARDAVAQRRAAQEGAAAGYAPPYALPSDTAYAGAAPNAADRAMAEAIEIMRESEHAG